MSTPVIQVINMFAEHNISAVPIVDKNNVVLNVYETIDVMVRIQNKKKEANSKEDEIEYCYIWEI